MLNTLRTHAGGLILWVICSLIGSLLPIWVTIFVGWLFDRPFDINRIILHGDFFLYSAAFLAPVIYQVGAQLKKQETILGLGWIIFAVIALLFSAIAYMAVDREILNIGTTYSPGLKQTTIISFILFGVALLFSVSVFLNEQQLLDLNDIKGAEAADQKALLAKVTSLSPVAVEFQKPSPQVETDSGAPETELMEKFKEPANV